jgi:hypothetical protein
MAPDLEAFAIPGAMALQSVRYEELFVLSPSCGEGVQLDTQQYIPLY